MLPLPPSCWPRQERYHEGYWIPGGGVDPGESLRDGVVREAWEEAGARIKVRHACEGRARDGFGGCHARSALVGPTYLPCHGERTKLIIASNACSCTRLHVLHPISHDVCTGLDVCHVMPCRRQVTGILTVESSHHGAWRRVIFLAEPDVPSLPNDPRVGVPGAGGTADPRVAEALCKTLPDVESAGACWAHAHEVPQLPLRSASEPLTWIPYVAGGGRVVPLPLEDPEACPDLARVFPDVPL